MAHRLPERIQLQFGTIDPEWVNIQQQPFMEEISGKLNQHNIKQMLYDYDDATRDQTNDFQSFAKGVYTGQNAYIDADQIFDFASTWQVATDLEINITSLGSFWMLGASLQVDNSDIAVAGPLVEAVKPGARFGLLINGDLHVPSLIGSAELDQDKISIDTVGDGGLLPSEDAGVIIGRSRASSGDRQFCIQLDGLVYLPPGTYTIAPGVFIPVGDVNFADVREIGIRGSCFAIQLRK